MSWPGAWKEELEIPMASVSAAATQTARIDTVGADYAIVRVLFYTWATTNTANGSTISLLHADDTVVTNFATIVTDETHVAAAVGTLQPMTTFMPLSAGENVPSASVWRCCR